MLGDIGREMLLSVERLLIFNSSILFYGLIQARKKHLMGSLNQSSNIRNSFMFLKHFID
jgi:hypothetical protein